MVELSYLTFAKEVRSPMSSRSQNPERLRTNLNRKEEDIAVRVLTRVIGAYPKKTLGHGIC